MDLFDLAASLSDVPTSATGAEFNFEEFVAGRKAVTSGGLIVSYGGEVKNSPGLVGEYYYMKYESQDKCLVSKYGKTVLHYIIDKRGKWEGHRRPETLYLDIVSLL